MPPPSQPPRIWSDMLSTLFFVLVLGMRHGVDADHLAAIDGFTRLRPSRWNGVLFGLGHGLVVTLLAVLIGHLAYALDFGWLAPYLFLGVAALNVWRLRQSGSALTHTHTKQSALAASPFLMGLLLAVGMETGSQLSALALVQSVPPLLLGLTFTLGMMLTDGVDGVLASALQRGEQADPKRAELASRLMGWMVVLLSLGFAGAGFLHLDADAVAGPLGLLTFAALLGLRLWSRLGVREAL